MFSPRKTSYCRNGPVSSNRNRLRFFQGGINMLPQARLGRKYQVWKQWSITREAFSPCPNRLVCCECSRYCVCVSFFTLTCYVDFILMLYSSAHKTFRVDWVFLQGMFFLFFFHFLKKSWINSRVDHLRTVVSSAHLETMFVFTHCVLCFW